MPVRQAIVASLLAITAIGAMSQELDPAETLQGKSLAAQRENAAQARARQSAGAAASAASAASDTKHAAARNSTAGRLDLTRWHPARKPTVVAARG